MAGAALALLLAAAGAGAAPPPGCSVDQAARIEAGFAGAERRAAAALLLLVHHPAHPHVRRWFGTAPREGPRRVLKLTHQRLRPASRPPVACAGAHRCGGTDIFALALLEERRILLCPRFFAEPPGRAPGLDSRAGTLVHEVSHLAAGTEDTAYQPQAARALARRDPKAAASNADNHQYFVELLPAGHAPDPPAPKGPAGGAPPWKPALAGQPARR
jgi:peptidyl-Lys metalloendopeptidase